MKLTRVSLFVFLIAINFLVLPAQTTVEVGLLELIQRAQDGSSAALLSETRLKNQYWRYVAFKSFFKPQLSLNGDLPSLNRSISSITLPDGSEAFVNRSFMSNSLGLQITQNIMKTGGSVFLGSDIQRLDLFSTNVQNKSTSYLSAPLNIGFVQPLFAFNQFKWNQELQKMQYTRAGKRRVEENEMIAIEVLNRYFDLYLTELNLETIRDNFRYLDSLAIIAEGRFGLGRIGETEMLQVQLSAQNSRALVARLEQDRQDKNERLRNYLGLEEQVLFVLIPPDILMPYDVSFQRALDYAREHRSEIADFEIRIKQAQLEVEQAKYLNRPEISLTGRFGLTQTAQSFGDAFRGLQDQESVRLSFNVPIADWGRSKSQREIAKSDLELEELQVRQERINLEREIDLATSQIYLVREQLILAERAFQIAEKRQDIAKKRYTLGTQDATNLNIAIQEYASAKENYYSVLWDLWQIHYRIRMMTLFDFQLNVPLRVDVEVLERKN